MGHPMVKSAAHDACFPAGLLAFSKLLEILPSVWCNFSNLLNISNPAGKQALCAAGLRHKVHGTQKNVKRCLQ